MKKIITVLIMLILASCSRADHRSEEAMILVLINQSQESNKIEDTKESEDIDLDIYLPIILPLMEPPENPYGIEFD